MSANGGDCALAAAEGDVIIKGLLGSASVNMDGLPE